MSFDKIFDLTAGVYFHFYNRPIVKALFTRRMFDRRDPYTSIVLRLYTIYTMYTLYPTSSTMFTLQYQFLFA